MRAFSARLPLELPRYEFPDALVTPGFVDGHTHFALWALGRRRVQLAGALTRAEAVRRVAEAQPEQGWVLGQGWDANRWDEPPHRAALDAVQAGPVYLDSLDVHAAWVNTAALRAAQIGAETPDPPGGRIVRDGSGQPTGLLLERAVELVTRVLPRPPADRLDQALLDAQAEAHRLGVTGIHDVEDDAARAAFGRLDAAGRLRLRVLFHTPVGSLPDAGPGRRAERHGLRVAGAGRREDVPRREPRQPHRLDAAALRGQPGSRHAAHRRGRGRARDAARRGARDRLHRARHRRCGRASRARPHDAAPAGRAAPPDRALPVRRTRPISTGPRRPGSWPRCSRPISSPTFPWWTATGARAEREPTPSARCSSGAPPWCSAATCRSPRSIRARVSSRRSIGTLADGTPADGGDPRSGSPSRTCSARLHRGGRDRRGRAAPTGHARRGHGRGFRGLGGGPGGGAGHRRRLPRGPGRAHGRRRGNRDASVTGSH